jgi:hypothetical protein
MAFTETPASRLAKPRYLFVASTSQPKSWVCEQKFPGAISYSANYPQCQIIQNCPVMPNTSQKPLDDPRVR